MKIALVDLCKEEDFVKHRSYTDSINFLKEESIDFLDFATGTDNLDSKIELFHKALDSDVELIWFIRGGTECLKTLDKIDWNKVKNANKVFYGISDFTHFAILATSKMKTCFYGQGLSYIKDYMPRKKDREFILSFIKGNKAICEDASPLALASNTISLSHEKVTGGFLPGFILLQNKINIDLSNIFVFFEYHSSAVGQNIDELGYLLNQFVYICKKNKPKGIILGHIEINNIDGTQVDTNSINEYCIIRLKDLNLPLYYIDHFKNTIKFSLN